MVGHLPRLLRERMMADTPTNDLVLRALRGGTTERTPVWLMRQAGRFDPAYRELRARAGLELEELFASPEHAAEISMLPVRYGVDAVILFQDILTPLGPMGAPFVFRPGPVIDRPIRTGDDADRLEEYDPREHLAFIMESIRLTLDRIDGRMPLLGFAGAPFTLLCFLVCGGSPRDAQDDVARFLREHPDAAHALLGRIASVTASYLRAKIDAGVHAVQLFESCAGLLEDDAYAEWALPYQQRVFAELRDTNRPTIIFAKDAPPELLHRSGA
ncbi:MAG: uroporphyrinogen decarboxylase family protein, partial [Planctomycetota bacterium]